MNYPEAFLWMSAIAYITFAFVPKKTTKLSIPKIAESLMMISCAILLIVNLIFDLGFVWFIYGIIWSFGNSVSWLGYVQWNLQWTNKTSDIMQASMWLWDLLIAICCFVKAGV